MSFSLVPGFAQRYPKVDDDLLIESCCTSLDEARWAETRGANRIELCTDLSVGGLTPPRDLIREVVQALTIPVNVLIRPSSRESGAGGIAARKHATLGDSFTGALPQTPPLQPAIAQGSPSRLPLAADAAFGFSAADFVYDEAALEQMIDDIGYCKTVGVSGIVVGALTEEGAIDLPAMRRLVAAARPLPVTFHRAFDVCTDDPFTALDQIIALGCTRLLTSGRAPSAWDGRNLIALLVRRAGARLSVMPGAGIKREKTAALADATAAVEFHGTAIP
ncbi:MAG: copper homeostasis protein CutC [Bacteroidales bacterium]